jgi:hypothetical protein
MASSDTLTVIHATPLFVAKRRSDKARRRGTSEGSKALGQGSMGSSEPTVVHLQAHRDAKDEHPGNFNVGILQIPRERVDPRLRYLARLLDRCEQGDAPKS